MKSFFIDNKVCLIKGLIQLFPVTCAHKHMYCIDFVQFDKKNVSPTCMFIVQKKE